MKRLPLFLGFLSISAASQAGPIEDLSAVLNGRVGGSSEDRRQDVHQDVLGAKLKIGCKGNTFESNVKITGVTGKMEADTAIMSVTYSGSYSRQGWDIPCQKVSSNLGGIENRNVTGTYQFRVTGKAFQKPTITWGSGSSFGEIADGGHDSNVFAIRAVQNAIASAF